MILKLPFWDLFRSIYSPGAPFNETVYWITLVMFLILIIVTILMAMFIYEGVKEVRNDRVAETKCVSGILLHKAIEIYSNRRYFVLYVKTSTGFMDVSTNGDIYFEVNVGQTVLFDVKTNRKGDILACEMLHSNLLNY